MEVIELLGSAMGLAFVAGINLYATILSVGLGLRYGFIQLPPDLAALSILAHPYILWAAAIMYAVEFFADKVPWVDTLWDTVHTFIRPFGAAILGVTAIGSVDPAVEIAVFLLCGGVALSSHFTKAGTRLVVNQSPEPFSNIVLSVVEDFFAVIGSWLSVTHPLLMLVIVLAFFVCFGWLAPKIFRLIRVELLAVVALFRSRFGSTGAASRLCMTDPPIDTSDTFPRVSFPKKKPGFVSDAPRVKVSSPGAITSAIFAS
jgi:hypothetical protein